MRWRGREQSENVEDRRGMGPATMAMGGGGILVLIMAVVALFMGADPRDVAGLVGQAQRPAVVPGAGKGAGVDDDNKEFVAVVLRDTEQVWTKLFQENVQGGRYQPPRLVMFSGAVQTACGTASAAVGPFYCPGDQQVYIDPAFFDELARRHKAPGDFASAYVIAHEVAHHVQHLLGFDGPVNQIRQRGSSEAANQASVRLELQADYLAGVWAHHAHRDYAILEQGDLEEAIRAANQIGDDTLQKQATGFVIPERFTHGTSAQRVKWFSRGFQSGDMGQCQQLFKLDYSQL